MQMEGQYLILSDGSRDVIKLFMDSNNPVIMLTDGTNYAYLKDDRITYEKSAAVIDVMRYDMYGMVIPNAVHYDRRYIISTAYSITENDCYIVYNGVGNSTMTLPSSPNVGQLVMVSNTSNGYTVTVVRGGTTIPIYNAGASVTSVAVPDRHMITLIYTGSQWQVQSLQ